MRLSLLSLFLLVSPLIAADVPLTVKGDLSVVKVDVIVKHQEDRTVIKSLPFTISAPATEAFYFWTYPPGVVAVDKGQVLEVTAAPKGELVISVKSIKVDWDAKKFLNDFGSIKVIVGGIVPPTPPTPPAPPPVPPAPPPVPPAPPKPPAPIPTAGLRVLVVYEATAKGPLLTSAQANELYGEEFAKWLNANCVKVGTQAEWRIWDTDTQTAGASELWQKAMARPRSVIPWLLVSNGVTGWEGPLPAGGSILAKIKEYSR